MIENLSANLWQMWAVVSVVCLIVELMNGDFFIVCFSIGAVAATIAAPFVGFFWQLAVFIFFSALSIFFVRPFALRYLHRNDSERVSNADAIIGQTGVVSTAIPAGGFGRVALGGDDWKAVADSQEEIPVGTKVEVVGRESIIITVRRIEN